MQKVSQHVRFFFTGRFRIASVLSISLLAMLLLQVAGVSARSLSQNPVYYACANYKTGKIYVIQQICSDQRYPAHRGRLKPASQGAGAQTRTTTGAPLKSAWLHRLQR